MLITILTPAHNRAHTLKRLFHSLEKQSCKDFRWLIVDDGSTDNTDQIVNELKESSTFNIDYLKKSNGGKHTAINEGVKKIETELTFIVDSDDFLTSDAIETIYNLWGKYSSDSKLGGIWLLDKNLKGRIIGDKFPNDEFIGNYVDIMINSKVSGDKATVYLTKALAENPSPVFAGEKRVATGFVHKRISYNYNVLFVNKAIYICDYQEDGLSNAGLSWRIKNPIGGMASSKELLTKDVKLTIRIKKMILYLIYSRLAGISYNKAIISSQYPLLAILCTPVAFVIFSYWKKKYL